MDPSLLDPIYDLRTAVEENIKTSFRAQGFKAFTRVDILASTNADGTPKTGAGFQNERPRIELQARIGNFLNHVALCPDKQERRDQCQFELSAQLVTVPALLPADNYLHTLYQSRVRGFFSTLAQSTWNDLVNWPLHAIAESLIETGTEDNLKGDKNFEFSMISFRGVIGVRSTAWPT